MSPPVVMSSTMSYYQSQDVRTKEERNCLNTLKLEVSGTADAVTASHTHTRTHRLQTAKVYLPKSMDIGNDLILI